MLAKYIALLKHIAKRNPVPSQLIELTILD